MKPVGKQNQGVRSQNPKDFPALLLKILPAALVVAGLEACHSTSVSANTTSSKAPVVAPAGSVLRVRLDQTLDSRRSQPGDRFTGVLDTALIADGKEILPKGTIVSGHVLAAHSPGRESDHLAERLGGGREGRATLSLVLDSCRANDKELALSTDTVTRVNLNRARHSQQNWILVGGGTGAGAPVGVPGTSADGAPGTAAYSFSSAGGANVGARAATQNNGAGDRNVFMPAESVVGFTLRSPLVV